MRCPLTVISWLGVMSLNKEGFLLLNEFLNGNFDYVVCGFFFVKP